MAEVLINRNDFELYKPLPKTVDWESLVPVILRMQRGQLRDLLGAALYYDVHTTQTGNNATLINGGAYSYEGNTIDFYGLKPAIVLYSWASFIKGNDFKVTLSGNKKKRANESENADNLLIMQEYQKALNEARGYMDEVLKYLITNRGTFPLWQGYAKPAKGGFKVGIATQVDWYSEDDNYKFGGKYLKGYNG